MGRKPCCGKGVTRGAWSDREDKILINYIKIHGEGKWREVPRRAGLRRCGKSCRLRWLNYLRPDIKRGNISDDEEDLIIRLHKLLGNRWTLIAGRLPGRTDNEIKNYWNTILSKRVQGHNKKPNRSSKKLIKTTQTQQNLHSTHQIICPAAVRCRNGITFSQHQRRNPNHTQVLTDQEHKTVILNPSSEDRNSCSGFLMGSEIKISEPFLPVRYEKENDMDFGDDCYMVNINETWSGGVDPLQENDEWGLEDIASFLVAEDD